MMAGLRDVLGLPELGAKQATAQAEEFAKAFREGMAGLNDNFQIIAAQASPDLTQPLGNQRQQLFDAFHKVTGQIDSQDPTKAESPIGRVLAAVEALGKKVSQQTAGLMASRDEWLKREGKFDTAGNQIRELEEAQNAKATALRKVSDTIQSRVNEARYTEAITTLDQLLPKLEQIYAQHQKQAGGGADPEKFSAMLAELEKDVEQLIAEHKLEV